MDSLLTINPLEKARIAEIEDQFQSRQPQQLISSASNLLSGLTHFAGLVVAPRRAMPKIRQIEFVSLSEKRTLLILVTADGDVQNRILITERGYSAAELVTAANILNQHFAGLDFDQIRSRLHDELRQLRSDLQSLMTAALAAGDQAPGRSRHPYVISGERTCLRLRSFPATCAVCASCSTCSNNAPGWSAARRVQPAPTASSSSSAANRAGAARRVQRRHGALRSQRPHRRLGRRHRPDADGLRPRHPDRRYHGQAALVRPELPGQRLKVNS